MPKKITISPPKASLLEKAFLLPVGRQPSDWLSRMAPDNRSAVEELLLAKIDGRLQASAKQIVDLLVSEGIDATPNKVARALDLLSQRR